MMRKGKEKRESVGEEIFGPPVAVPFKWEETPGKAKPSDAEKILQIKNDDDFYRLLLSKEGKLGLSSGSLYRPEDAGTVPFVWEAEPGKPKNPARVPEYRTPSAPLNPPPSFHFSPRHPSEGATSRSASISLRKWIFPGRSAKSGEQLRESNANSFSREASTWQSGSSEAGASKSSNYSSDFSSKSGTCSSSACSSRAASPRRKFYPQGAACFSAKSEAASFRRSTSTGSSSNTTNIIPAGPSGLRNTKNSFSSELLRGGGAPQNLRKQGEERGEFDQEIGLEFQNAVSESTEDSEEAKYRLSDDSDSGDKGAITDLEILIRFQQFKRVNKKVAPIFKGRASESPRGFAACMPLCAIISRRARVYEDCLVRHGKR